MPNSDDSGVALLAADEESTTEQDVTAKMVTMFRDDQSGSTSNDAAIEIAESPIPENVALPSSPTKLGLDCDNPQEMPPATADDVEEPAQETDEEDLSEGSDINEHSEVWRYRGEDLETRIELAPKRLKQYKQYATILEERVSFLENKCSDLDKRLRRLIEGDDAILPRPPPPPSEENTLKPELKFKLSKDFASIEGMPPQTEPITHQIDVFVGELETQKNEKFRRRKMLPKTMEEGKVDDREIPPGSMLGRVSELTHERTLEEEIIKIQSKHFPERIRLNSDSMRFLFGKYLTQTRNPNDVLLRPFKPLLQNKEEIREIMSEVIAGLTTIVNERATKDKGATKDPKAPDDSNTTDSSHTPIEITNTPPTGGLEDPPAELSDPPHTGGPSASDSLTVEDWNVVLGKIAHLDWDIDNSEMLVLSWPTLSEVGKSFECIDNLFDKYLLPAHTELRDRKVERVRFCDLWHLFQTGDLVVTKPALKGFNDPETQSQLGMRVLMTAGGRRVINPGQPAPLFRSSVKLLMEEDWVQPINGVNPFYIHAYYLDFNGTRLVPVRKRIAIAPYSGERNILDLEIVPIEYAADASNMLQQRGKKFFELVTASTAPYVDCKGVELHTREELNDKVIVDMKGYFSINPSDIPFFQEPEAPDISETTDCYAGNDCSIGGTSCHHRSARIVSDQICDLTAYQDYIEEKYAFNPLSGTQTIGHIEPPDYSICHYRVFAYKLRSRDWVQVRVSDLEAPQETEKGRGFDKLVLSSDHKSILKSQVLEHFRKRVSQATNTSLENDMDLVRGKGQGLIILLHGAPGVGKTCTAECIADLVDKPLYPLTCGDLGSVADDVEMNLKKHFTLASRWDCVMLLDEADVFLAKRKLEDLQRNSIVSVFLRMLEYYKGLLFLTTNRVGTFDEAFTSRVHISLFYPNFDKTTTMKVWKTFIDQTQHMLASSGRKNFVIDAEGIEEFARKHWKENKKARWNGRQIRNSFHTAVAMAEFRARDAKTDTGYDHHKDVMIRVGKEEFEKIAKTAKEFNAYMTETLLANADTIASREGWRRVEREQEKNKKKSKSKKKVDTSSESSSEDDDNSS